MTHQVWNGITTPPNEVAPAWETDDCQPEIMTLAEQRISWICDDWADAIFVDTYEEWLNVRMSIYGAKQMLNQIPPYYEETRQMLTDIYEIALRNGSDCIARGKYEGA